MLTLVADILQEHFSNESSVLWRRPLKPKLHDNDLPHDSDTTVNVLLSAQPPLESNFTLLSKEPQQGSLR